MLIHHTCKWRDGEFDTWWRELTAGQANELLSGAVLRHEGETKLERSVMEVDLQLNDTQQKKLVQFTCCKDDKGTAMFPDLRKLLQEPVGKVRALVALAESARKQYDEGEAGNA